MEKILTFLKVSGIWLFFVLWIMLMCVYCMAFHTSIAPSPVVQGVTLVSIIITAFYAFNNLSKVFRGKDARDISLLEGLSTEPDEYAAGSNKKKYTYPRISEDILYKKPQGFCFGRDTHTGMYICRKVDEEGAVLISGGSGTGKSSCYIVPYLLWCKGIDLDQQ